MFAAEAEYERHGDIQDVVFPCGYTVANDGDTINLYYGAADSSIALAHGSIRPLSNGSMPTATRNTVATGDTRNHFERSGQGRLTQVESKCALVFPSGVDRPYIQNLFLTRIVESLISKRQSARHNRQNPCPYDRFLILC